MDEFCTNCKQKVEIAIFKNDGWCSAACMKAIANARSVNKNTGPFPRMKVGEKHITQVNNARRRLGMPLL